MNERTGRDNYLKFTKDKELSNLLIDWDTGGRGSCDLKAAVAGLSSLGLQGTEAELQKQHVDERQAQVSRERDAANVLLKEKNEKTALHVLSLYAKKAEIDLIKSLRKEKSTGLWLSTIGYTSALRKATKNPGKT